MPKTYKFEGKTVTVPDDATMEEVESFFSQKPTVQPTPGSVLRPMTEREQLSYQYPVGAKGESVGENITNAARNAFTGMADITINLPGTVGSLIRSVNPADKAAANPIQSTYEGLNTRPGETLSRAAGQTVAAEGLGGSVTRAGKGAIKSLTKTGPKVAGDLAKETRAANEAATAKAAEETAKQSEKHAKDVEKIEGKRKVELGKHFQKTQEAKAANEAAQGKVSRKAAINRGVERLDTEVRGDLGKLEEKVNKEANQKYNDLKKVLKNEKADRVQALNDQGQPVGQPKNITEHLDDVAHAPLRGTESETPIMKSLSRRVENGEIDLTYDDLQGYREEVGRELRKGTLPPDVYTGYKNLINAIDDAMDKIAARKGLKPAQDAARAFYRQYAETFLDSDAVARKALDSAERGGVAKAYQGKDQSGIEQIAKYDPQVAQRLNSLRGYQAEGKALPSKTGKLTSLPKLEPKPATPPAPPPVRPELKTVGPEEVQGAKLKSLTGRTEAIRNRGGGLASTFAIIDAIRNAFHGNMAGVGTDIAVRTAFGVGKHAIANLLERPEVVRFLTKPTAADIAAIPEDMRGDFSSLAQEAANRGIKVSPALYAAAGAPQRKRVGDILKPAK